jgi:hypothetical protein
LNRSESRLPGSTDKAKSECFGNFAYATESQFRPRTDVSANKIATPYANGRNDGLRRSIRDGPWKAA